jgi:hypothetical protein
MDLHNLPQLWAVTATQCRDPVTFPTKSFPYAVVMHYAETARPGGLYSPIRRLTERGCQTFSPIQYLSSREAYFAEKVTVFTILQ